MDSISIFYQHVSIASYANRCYSQRRNVCLSICPSVTLRYCIKMKTASVMISSPSESQNILVSRNIWFITKFDRDQNLCGYSLEFAREGTSNESGVVVNGDFRFFRSLYLPNLHIQGQNYYIVLCSPLVALH